MWVDEREPLKVTQKRLRSYKNFATKTNAASQNFLKIHVQVHVRRAVTDVVGRDLVHSLVPHVVEIS